MLAAWVSSTTPTAAASEVFISSAMQMLPIGWITARSACGRITCRRDWPKVSPMARAASAWPTADRVDPGADASAEVGALVHRDARSRRR